ncbi:hypothetical protein B0H66DRAFT_268507 [Apodospora peruviana]|uniref:Uncharacterized protein n=1 Tax=Apodospora peruviana TaxID=516989 RepID=A0AAE0M564_9PEZI|nr:hypothetical protein B0H66DRAFT_268507 [Apodospora peruviana]
MSRNIRQKYPTTPVKVAKRRGSDTSSSLNLSDDDGYSGVEDVSDSDEDDEEHVFAAEEEHILTNVTRKKPLVPPRPVIDEDEDADEENEDDDDDDEDDGEPEDGDVTDETESWDGILTDQEAPAAEELPSNFIFQDDMINVERHVRFAGVPDSDSDSTTSETSDDLHGFFPDIFVDQNNLDPSFRREIENDDNSSNSGSFWDFHSGSQDLLEPDSDEEFVAQISEEITPLATPMASQPPTEASTPVAVVQDLDGYESDGDTTEEDVPEPPVRRKQIRRIQSVDVSSGSDTERPRRFPHGKPRVGRFNLDTDKKPIAVLNSRTRKMMIFTPQRMNRLDLSPESFDLNLAAPDLSNCSPILSNPGYIMMGGMFSSNTFGDFMNTQPFGPAEAFFPLTSDATGVDTDDSDADIPEADEEESMLHLEDFITFHHDSSDEEEEAEQTDYFGDVASSPTRPKTAASGASGATDASMDVHPLLEHFGNNSNSVGAFRRNQINQQLILSEQISQDSLAFSGPYYHGTLKGIKSGSLETVTTPITPARRVKRGNTVSGMNGLADLPASPLTSMSQKRKAANPLGGADHKRHRSISDMEVLQI